MKMKIAALALLASMSLARAQTPDFYVLKDQSSPQKVLNMGIFTSGGKSTPASASSDAFGNPLSGVAGTTNPNGTGLFIQGLTGGVPVTTVFAAPQHTICDSGCLASSGGTSSNFGATFPTLGTAIGVSNGTNMVAITLGQAVSSSSLPVVLPSAQITALTPPTSVGITGSVAVTGTFWPYTLGQQVNGSSVPVVLTAAQLATLTPPGAISGFSTAANQATNAATTAHTCAIAGFSELGCLGQIDDDIKGSIAAGSNTIGSVGQAGSWTVSLSGSIPSGSNTIGSIANTSFAATQSTASALNATIVGTGTFAAQITSLPSLIAGSAIIGKVGIDQTTPGTTNLVALAANQSVNQTQLNSVALGSPSNYGTSPGAVSVQGVNAFVTNTVAVTLASTTITGTVAATQSGTWNIGSITTLPALVAGSAIVGKFGIDQTTPGTTNLVSIGTNGTVNPTTAANWGLGATGAAVPASAAYIAAAARSSEPTAATTGNLTGGMFDLVGKQVTSPYANRENMVRASGSSTSTSAITLLAAAGASIKNYVTDLSCTRSDAGTTAITVTLNDSSAMPIDIPNNGGGGGYAKSFGVPLVTAANTALTATPSAGVTTLHCTATGFTGY